MINLAEFNDLLASGDYGGNRVLSGTTELLCLTFLLYADKPYQWEGANGTPDTTEQGEIDQYVAEALTELMRELMVLLPTSRAYHAWEFEPTSGNLDKGYSPSADNGTFAWTSSYIDGEIMKAPLSLQAGSYTMIIGYWKGTVGGLVTPKIWDGSAYVNTLTQFNTYVASGGGYNNLQSQTLNIADDIPEGEMHLLVNHYASGGSNAKTLTLQDLVILRT